MPEETIDVCDKLSSSALAAVVLSCIRRHDVVQSAYTVGVSLSSLEVSHDSQ